MGKNIKRNGKPADLDGLLEKEVKAAKKTADRLPNGRTVLANYLGIRLSEVSRYFERKERRPNGRILAGMRAFVKKHARPPKPPYARPATSPMSKARKATR